ncbi:hypothetical protein AgCh_038164 [Apium graveolens]
MGFLVNWRLGLQNWGFSILHKTQLPSLTLYVMSSSASLHLIFGLESQTKFTNFFDPAFYSDLSICYLQPKCAPNSTFPVTIRGASSIIVQQVASCVQGLQFWRNSSSDFNDELYKGFRKGNSGREINEIITGYDMLNSDVNNFIVSIWYNSTVKNDIVNRIIALIRVPRLIISGVDGGVRMSGTIGLFYKIVDQIRVKKEPVGSEDPQSGARARGPG